MTLVNNPGDWGHIYAPLEHAHWNGCTPTDLVFPFFLFIMGVSVVYAMQTKKADAVNHTSLMLKVLRRTLIIFGLGIFMAIFLNWNFATVRIPGVLQRIAIVYLICGLLFIKSGVRTQTLVLGLVLIGYYLIMTYIPVPGFGEPNLDAETNLGAWLDRKLLTTNHLWNQSKTWDPEGILSTMPAIGTGLLGLLTGTWIKRTNTDNKTKIYAMLGVGFILSALGMFWNFWFPINKSLWTSSYVLFSGGLAIIVFALCYWLIDVQGYRRFTKPFLVYGLNAIFVYVISGMMARGLNRWQVNYQGGKTSMSTFLYQSFFSPYFSPINASLAWAVTYMLVWLLILWAMYSRRIFIKI